MSGIGNGGWWVEIVMYVSWPIIMKAVYLEKIYVICIPWVFH